MSAKTTREKIMQSAAKLFVQNGYNGASIRAITNDAKVNLSMVSYHFGGKEALYVAIMESYLNQIMQMIDRIENDDSMNAMTRLRTYFFAISDILSNNRYFATLFMMEVNNPTSGGTKIIQKYFVKFRSFIIDTIDKGAQNGELRNDININNITFFFVSIMSFYNIVYNYVSSKEIIQMGNFPSDDYLNDAFSMLVASIKA